MHIELIGSRQQFDGLQDNWTELYQQDSSANVFMSWCWLKQLYDRRAEPVCILAARLNSDSQNYAAFLPLRQRLLLDREQARFTVSYALAGNDWADQTGLLCSPDIEHQVVEAFTAALAQMSWRSLYFSDMSMSENRYEELVTQFSNLGYAVDVRSLTDNEGETRLDVAPCIALPATFEDYLKSLSANTRQRLRRFGRVQEKSDDLKIEFSDHTTHEQNLQWFVRVWRERWLASKGAKVDTLAEKYQIIMQQGLEDGNLVLLVMHQSDKPIAMIACYLDEIRKTVSFFVAARDLQFDSVPSGLLLHSYMIQWAISNNYQRYHLLRGNEPYKYSLGGIDEPVYSIRVRRSNAVEKTRFLPIEYRGDALEQLSKRAGKLGRRQMHKLYSQLLESWPNDAQTLSHYKDWLNRIGDHDHANSIENVLFAEDTQSKNTLINPHS
ncbi:GNAT family N-acetyltransferase [Granulosicoccus antarcticus]|uniref:BioF2-like acetyltransferase domain-containing protein n=1 Tax=Granulosicoccus antarcticus IMCC3135 TaxID=1192854 RepID=A0A2Z2NWD0_9GAMM|nr:GNAT family N-acetyltransferase [Granulosicoccus antarcticus]ASJ73130.1 hypothetical protein IMCC3135_15230 [Granulosicoccus antarcticus IMCC3135]